MRFLAKNTNDANDIRVFRFSRLFHIGNETIFLDHNQIYIHG